MKNNENQSKKYAISMEVTNETIRDFGIDPSQVVWTKNGYGNSSGFSSGADNIVNAIRLKEYYTQAEKYGTGSIKELENGRVRFYGKLKLARTKGEMVGARYVREWNPDTGYKRDWYETLDHNGNTRQIRPNTNITDGIKVHYRYDADGNYIGNW